MQDHGSIIGNQYATVVWLAIWFMPENIFGNYALCGVLLHFMLFWYFAVKAIVYAIYEARNERD